MLKITHHFDIWFLSYLRSLSINGFDNGFEIDLMVFSMTHIDGDNSSLEHRLNILGLVRDNFCTPPALATALRIQFSASNRGELFFPWFISDSAKQHTIYFQLLRHFFHDPKRSGNYFMSHTRYATAALHCVNFLFGTRCVLVAINIPGTEIKRCSDKWKPENGMNVGS